MHCLLSSLIPQGPSPGRLSPPGDDVTATCPSVVGMCWCRLLAW